jgi:hypothetical protein
MNALGVSSCYVVYLVTVLYMIAVIQTLERSYLQISMLIGSMVCLLYIYYP